MSEDADSDQWCTPKELAVDLGSFVLDPCANDRSHINSIYACSSAGEDDYDSRDGLTYLWTGSVFCNPPYSDVMPWAKRLVEHRGPWCALLKLDPTTKWWSILAGSGATWAPFRKRIKFERPDKPPLTANFPSVLIWRDWVPSVALQAWLWMPTDAREMLRRVLELVDRGAFMTHARQLVLREAEQLVKP